MLLLLIILAIIGGVYGVPPPPPPGHMKPLGAHQTEVYPIDVLEFMPTPEYFWKNHVEKWRPVLLKGAAKGMPAYTKWSPEYHVNKWPDMQVRLEKRIENRDDERYAAATAVSLREFYDLFKHTQAYTVSVLPHEMSEDVDIIPAMLCGDRDKSHIHNRRRWLTLVEEVGLWISNGKTQSQLHYDELNILNCLFKGRKEWKMVNTHKYGKYMPMNMRAFFADQIFPATRSSDYSSINVSHVDMKRYPQLQNVRVETGVQEAGDCMYIPYSYLHQVTMRDEAYSTAASIMFSRNERYTQDGCAHAPMTSVPLSAFDVTWYYSGDGPIPMGYPDPVDIRSSMMPLGAVVARAKTTKAKIKATRSHVREVLTEAVEPRGWSKRKLRERVDYWVRVFDRDNKGYITREDLNATALSTFAQLAVEIDYQHTTPNLMYQTKSTSEIRAAEDTLTRIERQFSDAAAAGGGDSVAA